MYSGGMCRHYFVWTRVRTKRREGEAPRPWAMWYQCETCGERAEYWCNLSKKWLGHVRPKEGSSERPEWIW